MELVGEEVGRIWEKLGEGKTMIILYCMKKYMCVCHIRGGGRN